MNKNRNRWTRDTLLKENDRLRNLLMTWEPPEVAARLREEMKRLRAEMDSDRTTMTDVLRDEIILQSKAAIAELQRCRKDLAAERHYQDGIVAKAKRWWRSMKDKTAGA